MHISCDAIEILELAFMKGGQLCYGTHLLNKDMKAGYALTRNHFSDRLSWNSEDTMHYRK